MAQSSSNPQLVILQWLMPELPEVETTRRGIDVIITGHVLRRLIVREPRMRWSVPEQLPELLADRTVLACARRGKYLLLHFEHGTQLIHLGMSGSLRRAPLNEAPRKHDHVDWVFDHAVLRLHDPRRFGAVLWYSNQDGPLENHPLLAKLGVEPFSTQFNGHCLQRGFQGRTVTVKQALLAGHAVVGVGNIYASESLFRAKINPCTPAGRLSLVRCTRLAAMIQNTLADALNSGGSTLRDYVGANGEPGSYFEIHAAVYERDGLPCRVCGTTIRRVVQGQRATYYCPQCQRA
jgi:formamidopyrimidine-DNA glycosylase